MHVMHYVMHYIMQSTRGSEFNPGHRRAGESRGVPDPPPSRGFRDAHMRPLKAARTALYHRAENCLERAWALIGRIVLCRNRMERSSIYRGGPLRGLRTARRYASAESSVAGPLRGG